MLKLGKKIGYGWSAEVFDLNEDQVLKLFFKDYSRDEIDSEFDISKKIFNAGLPSPKTYEMVDVSGRIGIVYEKIVGKSLIKLLPDKILEMNAYAKILARIHFGIHKTTIDGLKSQNELYEEWISENKYITQSQKARVLTILNELPEGRTLCHNDLHPPNVVMTKNGPIVIDWVSARFGDPYADVAYSEMMIRMGDLTMFPYGRTRIRMGRNLYSKLYRRHYLNLNPGDWDRVKRWMPVLIAARFHYQFKSEIPVLKRMLGSYLK